MTSNCIWFCRFPNASEKRLPGVRSVHPNNLTRSVPALSSRLPAIVSPLLRTHKASFSSTYRLLVKYRGPSGIAPLFVVASTTRCTAWAQLAASLSDVGRPVGSPVTRCPPILMSPDTAPCRYLTTVYRVATFRQLCYRQTYQQALQNIVTKIVRSK